MGSQSTHALTAIHFSYFWVFQMSIIPSMVPYNGQFILIQLSSLSGSIIATGQSNLDRMEDCFAGYKTKLFKFLL